MTKFKQFLNEKNNISKQLQTEVEKVVKDNLGKRIGVPKMAYDIYHKFKGKYPNSIIVYTLQKEFKKIGKYPDMANWSD